MSDFIICFENIIKYFGNVIVFNGVIFDVCFGECYCLFGDNGVGKLIFIKMMLGVYKLISGIIIFEGKLLFFLSLCDVMEVGIVIVFQDFVMILLMSVICNFFMGCELIKGFGLFKCMDVEYVNKIIMEEMCKMGINLCGLDQVVGILLGGECQIVVIVCVVYFGVKVFIFDEFILVLGVCQMLNVLVIINKVCV